MLFSTRVSLLTIAVFAWSVPPASAFGPVVRDKGHLFSSAAIKEANRELKKIRRESGRFVSIETVAAMPQAKGMGDEARRQFFAEWMKRHGKKAPIAALICKEPLHVQIEISSDLEKEGMFGGLERKELHDILFAKLQTGQKDQALHEGIRFIREALKTNLSTGAAGRAAMVWNATLWTLGSLLAIWLVLEGMGALQPNSGLRANFYGPAGSWSMGLFSAMAEKQLSVLFKRPVAQDSDPERTRTQDRNPKLQEEWQAYHGSRRNDHEQAPEVPV